jgi:hypothetical protein
VAMSSMDMPSYFARLRQPTVVAPAAQSQGGASQLAAPGAAAADDLLEVELFVDAEQSVNVQTGKFAKALQVVREPGEYAAEDKCNVPSRPTRKSGGIAETLVPRVSASPVLASEQSPSPQPAPTEARPGGQASDRTAEADLMQIETTPRTTDQTSPRLGEVLRWVAASPQVDATDAASAPDIDLRPPSRLVDPEVRPAQAVLPPQPATVQAFRHPPLTSDRFPSGAQGAGRMAGRELPSEAVVRIAIGEIRVRIEAPRESPRESPRETRPETPRISPPEMAMPSHFSSGADASPSFTASVSLRRRCIHL